MNEKQIKIISMFEELNQEEIDYVLEELGQLGMISKEFIDKVL